MSLPLSCIKGIFVSNMHHWGMGEKNQQPRVWKGPAENRENSGDTVFRGRSTAGSQTEGFGHWHITAQLQQQQAISSPPELSRSCLPRNSLCPAPAAPLRGQGKRGHLQLAERWHQKPCQSLRLGPSLGAGGRAGNISVVVRTYQESYFKMFVIPFSSLPVRKSQINLNDTTETLDHMKYFSVRLKSPVMTVKKKYRWVYNIFQTEAKENYSSSQISLENLHVPQWQQY